MSLHKVTPEKNDWLKFVEVENSGVPDGDGIYLQYLGPDFNPEYINPETVELQHPGGTVELTFEAGSGPAYFVNYFQVRLVRPFLLSEDLEVFDSTPEKQSFFGKVIKETAAPQTVSEKLIFDGASVKILTLNGVRYLQTVKSEGTVGSYTKGGETVTPTVLDGVTKGEELLTYSNTEFITDGAGSVYNALVGAVHARGRRNTT